MSSVEINHCPLDKYYQNLLCYFGVRSIDAIKKKNGITPRFFFGGLGKHIYNISTGNDAEILLSILIASKLLRCNF